MYLLVEQTATLAATTPTCFDCHPRHSVSWNDARLADSRASPNLCQLFVAVSAPSLLYCLSLAHTNTDSTYLTKTNMQLWVQFLCSIVFLAVVAIGQHWIPPTILEGKPVWIPHAATVVLVIVIALIPYSISSALFTPLTLILMGTAFPIYESVRAVCTPLEDDDKKWLQYWMVGGVLFMTTEWVGRAMSPESAIYWYEVCTIFFVWLFFPLTQGAALIYRHLTEPYLGPKVKPLVGKMDTWIQATYQMMMNAAHLWVIWIVFLFLPAGIKRTVAVIVGTVYPLASSIVAASTEEVSDDTYWLTYWSVYGCLFLIMETLEIWMGWIPGFYTLFILSTIYLVSCLLLIPSVQQAVS